jgi:hypothetical protein
VFIDNPSVPIQLETLLDLLYELRQKTATSESVKSLLQPKGLPDVSASSSHAANQLHAAKELQLVKQDGDGDLRLTYSIRDGKPSAKVAILEAFDSKVLSSPDVEPWFGRLYGFVIARNGTIPEEKSARDNLCTEFNEALPVDIDRGNQLNSTKLSHYLRWYSYIGMGWFDPSKRFILDPTVRLLRVLPLIFQDVQRLDAAPFMAKLAQICPELDCGSLFSDMSSSHYSSSDRVCTEALAIALRNLHDEGVIQLDCPKDSQGWSLENGGTVLNQDSLQSNRFDRVTLVSSRGHK